MNHAAISIFYFSFWVFASGLTLLLFPGPLLDLMSIDLSASIVARIFGMVLLFLGFYYFMAGRHGGMQEFYRWTTFTRPLALLFAIMFVLMGEAQPLLLSFVGVDVLGALWTSWGLRRDERGAHY